MILFFQKFQFERVRVGTYKFFTGQVDPITSLKCPYGWCNLHSLNAESWRRKMIIR